MKPEFDVQGQIDRLFPVRPWVQTLGSIKDFETTSIVNGAT